MGKARRENFRRVRGSIILGDDEHHWVSWDWGETDGANQKAGNRRNNRRGTNEKPLKRGKKGDHLGRDQLWGRRDKRPRFLRLLAKLCAGGFLQHAADFAGHSTMPRNRFKSKLRQEKTPGTGAPRDSDSMNGAAGFGGSGIYFGLRPRSNTLAP